MLVTLGFIALVVGIVLIVCGYTAAPQALRPGWAALIIAIILIALGYLIPALHPATTDDDWHAANTPTLN
jgi:uncharacterized membrane protein